MEYTILHLDTPVDVICRSAKTIIKIASKRKSAKLEFVAFWLMQFD